MIKCEGFILDDLTKIRDELVNGSEVGSEDFLRNNIRKAIKDLDTVVDYYKRVDNDNKMSS